MCIIILNWLWLEKEIMFEQTTEIFDFSEEFENSIFSKTNRFQTDMILAYEPLNLNEIQTGYRKGFEQCLQDSGLILEREIAENLKKKVTFIKIHVPDEIVRKKAQICAQRQSLLLESTANSETTDESLPKACHTNSLTEIQRIRLTTEVVYEVSFAESQLSERISNHSDPARNVDLNFLLKQKIFSAAFVPHDSGLQHSEYDRTNSQRIWLNENWTGCAVCLKPWSMFDKIVSYFGEKIAAYFCWLNFFTISMLILAIFGALALAFGIFNILYFKPQNAICNPDENLSVCSTCLLKSCKLRYISNFCFDATLDGAVSHYATVALAAVVCFWSMIMLKIWNRYEFKKSIDWNLPESFTKASTFLMPQNSDSQRLKISLCTKINIESAFIVFSLLSIVLSIILWKIFWVIVAEILVDSSQTLRSFGGNLSSIVLSSAAYALIMVILEPLHKILLRKILIGRAIGRSEDGFLDIYFRRLSISLFSHYFSGLFYLAFVENNNVSIKSNVLTENSPITGVFHVSFQVFVMLIFRQMYKFGAKVGKIIRKCLILKYDNPQTKNEHEFLLANLTLEESYSNYFDSAIEFAFAAFFTAICPLIPVISVIGSCLQRRIYSLLIIRVYRRPIPWSGVNIDLWKSIFHLTSRFGALIHALLIAFTTDFIDRLVYRFRYSPYDSEVGFYNFYLMKKRSPIEPLCVVAGGYNLRSDGLWLEVLLAKVLFVLIFQNVFLLFEVILNYFVSDKPAELEFTRAKKLISAQKLSISQTETPSSRKKFEVTPSSAKKFAISPPPLPISPKTAPRLLPETPEIPPLNISSSEFVSPPSPPSISTNQQTGSEIYKSPRKRQRPWYAVSTAERKIKSRNGSMGSNVSKSYVINMDGSTDNQTHPPLIFPRVKQRPGLGSMMNGDVRRNSTSTPAYVNWSYLPDLDETIV